MPHLTTAIETTVTETVELTPQLQARLERKLAAYAKLKAEHDRLSDELDVLKGDLADIRDVVGVKSLVFNGAHLTLVPGGTTKKLNLKKLYAKGITPKQYQDCIEEKPKKDSFRVTLPGEGGGRRADGDDE